jgi:small GTP-binding protein
MVNYKFKLVFMGDCGVGKTAIANRIVNNSFTPLHESTIGAGFMIKQIKLDSKDITYEIWDTAGQERYKTLLPMYYRTANCILLVFDITNKDTFVSLEGWVKDIKRELNTNDILLIIVGNKSDLENRCVSTEVANEFATSINGTYLEVSAKKDLNITEILTHISEMIPLPSMIANEPKQNIIIGEETATIDFKMFKCCY